jgi:hypothetical protein
MGDPGEAAVERVAASATLQRVGVVVTCQPDIIHDAIAGVVETTL